MKYDKYYRELDEIQPYDLTISDIDHIPTTNENQSYYILSITESSPVEFTYKNFSICCNDGCHKQVGVQFTLNWYEDIIDITRLNAQAINEFDMNSDAYFDFEIKNNTGSDSSFNLKIFVKMVYLNKDYYYSSGPMYIVSENTGVEMNPEYDDNKSEYSYTMGIDLKSGQKFVFRVIVPKNYLIAGDDHYLVISNEYVQRQTGFSVINSGASVLPNLGFEKNSQRLSFTESSSLTPLVKVEAKLCNYGNIGSGIFNLNYVLREKNTDGTYMYHYDKTDAYPSFRGAASDASSIYCHYVEFGGIPYSPNKELEVVFRANVNGPNGHPLSPELESDTGDNEISVMVGYKKILEEAVIVGGGPEVDSGQVVANSILTYLDMTRSYNILETRINMDTMSRILNRYSFYYYNFGSTKDLIRMGKIDMSKTTEEIQDQVNTWICHWIDYDVHGASDDRKNVPAAVALGDYDSWKMIYGFITNWDPFLNSWKIPDGVQLEGFYLRNPKDSDPYNHTYHQSDYWNYRVFSPLNQMETDEENIFPIVVEPPEQELEGVLTSTPPVKDQNVVKTINQIKWGYSYITPWETINEYNQQLHDSIIANTDFEKALNNEHFSKAIKDTMVARMYKIETGNNYALVPFDRNIEGKLSTSMIVVSGLDGTFKQSSVSSSDNYFQVKSRWDAMNEVQEETGRDVINNWLTLDNVDALRPVYKSVTLGTTENGYMNTIVHLSKKNGLIDINISPEITCAGFYENDGNIVYRFKIKDTEGYIYSVEAESYEILAIQDDIYELVVPQSTSAGIIEITARDNDSKDTIYAGGYSFYHLTLNQ
ncbi:MAG: hypothetical protein OMM_01538 [Candidatus Magnetoglobus multicellularis str. Araruama]|uniref:Uncharacterized protein n=1 Tax=Candidatus Magnetoglobus multicellularis str. Araruama TaxID=890399 RepID=A0A1V1PCU6_9BACT|nr:MAG: hypothetical protein OMM_01538 [Candidatus Magnetoglobus multicellularis str. Araruama]